MNWKGLAIILDEQGQAVEAIEHLERIVELTPGSTIAEDTGNMLRDRCNKFLTMNKTKIAFSTFLLCIFWLSGCQTRGKLTPTAVVPTHLAATTSTEPASTLTSTPSPSPSPVPPTSTISPPTAAVPITSTTTAFAITHPENLSAGDPYAPELGNSGYDVQRYTLQLALDPQQTYIRGNTLIQATSTMAGLDQISLDFIGFDISRVTVDGQPAAYFRQDNKLILQLPQVLQDGQAFQAEIAYSG